AAPPERRDVACRQLAPQPAAEDKQPRLRAEARLAGFQPPPRPLRRLLLAVAQDQLGKLAPRSRRLAARAKVAVEQGSHGVVAPRGPGGLRTRAAGESAAVGDAVVGY